MRGLSCPKMKLNSALQQLRSLSAPIRVISSYRNLNNIEADTSHRMLNSIAKVTGLKYTVIRSDHRSSGFNETTNKWAGDFGKLQRNKADIIADKISITYLRQQHFDFLPALEYDKLVFVTSPNGTNAVSSGSLWSNVLAHARFSMLRDLFNPFAPNVWFSLGSALLLAALQYILFSRLHSYITKRHSTASLRRSSAAKTTTPIAKLCNTAFNESLQFFRPLCNQGPTTSPTNPSPADILISAWCVFSLLITACKCKVYCSWLEISTGFSF